MRLPTMLLSVAMLSVMVDHCRATTSVFISIAGENRIARYELDEESGVLAFKDNVSVGGGPGALACSPSGRFLFASIRSIGSLASFVIQPSGQLKPINQVSAGADPAYLSVSRSGKFLISAYYRAGKVLVHEIDQSGRIGREVQAVDTDEKAHAAVHDRTGRYWFVPHTGPNAIFQFRFDDSTGLLSPNDPPRLIRDPPAGPRHLWFHPELNVGYTSDEQGRSVSTYRLDGSTGVLKLIQTLSTLPAEADPSQKGSTSDIEVHPSGKYVYVANRGHDSIAGYLTRSDTGELKHLGNTPTETTTRSFNIDSTGRFLIAAGQKSGKVAAFLIDPDTGGLTRIQTIEVGESPWWVLIVRSPGPRG